MVEAARFDPHRTCCCAAGHRADVRVGRLPATGARGDQQHRGANGGATEILTTSSVRSAMFIATPTLYRLPSSVGAAWMEILAPRQCPNENEYMPLLRSLAER